MRNMIDYLEAVRDRQNFNSDTDIAHALGIKRSSVSAYRRGIAFPSKKNMLELARLAGVDEQVALVELSFMQAADEETRKVYKSLMEKLTGVASIALMCVLCLSSTPSRAETQGEHIQSHLPKIYIITLKCRHYPETGEEPSKLKQMRVIFGYE